MIGFTSYTPFLSKCSDSNFDDCIEGIDYLVNILGKDNVRISTNWVQDQNIDFF